jgi:hypothetical protein
MDRELLECNVDGELLGGSENRKLVCGSVRCEVLDRYDNRQLTVDSVSRGPRG